MSDGPRVPLNVHDYEPLAMKVMHPSAWAYYSAGADDEVTLRREREAFERLRLVPRVLRGVDHADTSTTVLGTPIPAPIMVAQTGVQAPAHPEGECATARAAGEAGDPHGRQHGLLSAARRRLRGGHGPVVVPTLHLRGRPPLR